MADAVVQEWVIMDESSLLLSTKGLWPALDCQNVFNRLSAPVQWDGRVVLPTLLAMMRAVVLERQDDN